MMAVAIRESLMSIRRPGGTIADHSRRHATPEPVLAKRSMASSIASYLLSRSTSTTQIPRPKPSSSSYYEHVNIATVDTPTQALRSEILIGFEPTAPHSLVTLSVPGMTASNNTGPACEIGLWDFHPRRRVNLTRRLKVGEGADHLPVAIAATAFCQVRQAYYQVLYRTTRNGGEGCIEVRCLPLHKDKKTWSVCESVTEEDGIFGGINWRMATPSNGFIVIATASRVYFFLMDDENPQLGDITVSREWWSTGNRCLIFEVDYFLQQTGPLRGFRNVTYATCVLDSAEGGTSISVQTISIHKTFTRRFTLKMSPRDWIARLISHSKPDHKYFVNGLPLEERVPHMSCSLGYIIGVRSDVSIKGASTVTIFQPWRPHAQRTLPELVWEYGGIIIDCWDT